MSTASSKAQFKSSPQWRAYQADLARLRVQAEMCAPPSLFAIPPAFAGQTYEPEHDEQRLTGQLLAVFTALQDGLEHTLSDLRERCGGSETGISARLRDLKKPQFGAHDVRKRRTEPGSGLYVYWLANACQTAPNER